MSDNLAHVPRDAPPRAAAIALALALAGCQAGYVIEQGRRHLALRSREIPLESAELSEKLVPEEAEKLRWVPEILRFAREELGLEPGDSYRTLLDTGGEPISWIVAAAHPLALIPYRWKFPFAGTVAYKGFFDREDALCEARRIEGAGYEAEVWPVEAFSTLGWFEDPVIRTMLRGTPADLADLIFHETAHRTIYFAENTSFNESLASHLAREGTVRFLFSRPELRHLLGPYLEGTRARRERERLLLRLRADLDALYRSDLPDEAKLARKREIFLTAAAAYRRLAPEDERPGIPSSNASLLAVTAYHEHEGLLLELQGRLGGAPADLVAYLKRLPRGRDPVRALAAEIASLEP